jgi:hypothetical protein
MRVIDGKPLVDADQTAAVEITQSDCEMRCRIGDQVAQPNQ